MKSRLQDELFVQWLRMQGVIQNQRQAVLREVEGQKEQLDKVSTLLEKLKDAGYTKVGGFAREPGRL